MTDQKLSVISDLKLNILGDENSKQNPTNKNEYTLEEAIEEARIGKYQIILIVLTGLSIMGAGLENVSVGYVLSYAKCDLKLTMGEQGALTSVSFLGIVSTSYFWGFLADTWGRKKVISLSAFGGFLISFMSGFSPNTTILIVLRFLAGAFLAGSQAGAFSYISEFHTTQTAARATAFASLFLSALVLYLAPLAIVLMPMDWSFPIFSMNFKPWRLYLVCNSFLNLWNGIVFAILPESPKFLIAINEKEKALQLLRRVYAFNTGQPEQSYPVKSIKSESVGNNLAAAKGFTNIMRLLWSQTKPIFMPPLLTHTWKICFLIFAIFAIGHGTFMWFPDFLNQLQNYNGPPTAVCSIIEPKPQTDDLDDSCDKLDNKNTLSYQILLLVGCTFCASAALSNYLMKHISPKKIICTWILFSVGACLALNILTEFFTIVIGFVAFVSCVSCTNLVMAISVNLFPTKYRGMATAFVLMCGRIGGYTGANLVGLFLSYMCNMIFYVNSGLLISCIIVTVLLKT